MTPLEQQLADHHPAAFGWALACCHRRRDDAEDVLQDVYTKVLSGRATFRELSSFKTWLFGVIRLTALEHARWRWARRREVHGVETADVPASAPHVDRETTEALAKALAQLADRQREAIHLVFYEGLTIEESAVVMGISLGTARTHYERGKAGLLAILNREGVRFP